MAAPLWLACVGMLLQDPAPPTAPVVDELTAALEALVDAPTREARKALVASTARILPNDTDAWAGAMARFGRFDPVPAGVRMERVDLSVLGKRETTELWIYVPTKYDPAKPAPLMLSFHGTGGSGKGMHQHWRSCADELGMLVLAPSEAGPNDGSRFDDRERAAALAALRWMRRHHNVDENRTFASGISRGGHLTWDLALRYPDLFAGAAPMIGGPRLTLVAGQNNMRLLENVAQLSIRDLQGAQDDPGLVYSVRLAFELLGRFAPRDAKLLEFPDRGHDFDFGAVDWNAWIAQNQRDPAPERVVFCTATTDETRAFWLEIASFHKDVRETFAPKIPQGEWIRLDEDGQRRRMVDEAVARNARAAARRTGPGTFTVELDGATKVRLWLTEADMAKGGNLRIHLAGKYLDRKAKPDVRVMLEDFAERFDRTAIVRGRVDVP